MTLHSDLPTERQSTHVGLLPNAWYHVCLCPMRSFLAIDYFLCIGDVRDCGVARCGCFNVYLLCTVTAPHLLGLARIPYPHSKDVSSTFVSDKHRRSRTRRRPEKSVRTTLKSWYFGEKTLHVLLLGKVVKRGLLLVNARHMLAGSVRPPVLV